MGGVGSVDVEGGEEMALGDNCVHGGLCCNSVEHVDITTIELRELFITGLIIVHSLHSVQSSCLSVHPFMSCCC